MNTLHIDKVVHTVAGLGRNAGGPSRTVPQLCIALNKILTAPVELVCPHEEAFGALSSWAIEAGVTAIPDNFLGSNTFNHLCSLSNVTLVHDHGQWSGINRSSARFARRYGIPRIVTPRGMLSPWAMKHKRLKKRLAWMLYARQDIARAVMIHATSELELTELRGIGIQAPIAVIPNGIEEFEFLDKTEANRPYALFLSRVHRKKGILDLLEVWSMIGPSNWDLVIAGPDEENLLKSGSLPPNCRYVGCVEGREKLQLLRNAALFVLPTYSENFGVVVAEALACAVPVITTTGAPWKVLSDAGCGWWIQPGPESLRAAMQNAFTKPLAQLEQMGMIGRKVALERFDWKSIAEKMLKAYRWCLEKSETPPDFLSLPEK